MNLVLGLISVLRLAILLVLIFRIAGRRFPSGFAWSFLALAGVAVGASVLLGDAYGVDARIFWTAGRDVWEGRDPYAHPEFVHPPQALPMFALLALTPLPVFVASWAILGFLGYGLLAPLARKVLEAGGEPGGPTLAPADVALLSAAVLLSVPVGSALAIGQLAFVTTVAVYGAMLCRNLGRPIGAGVLLTLTSFKPTTLIPTLLLFLRKRDVTTWITLAVGGLALAFLVVGPADLAGTLKRNLGNIKALGAPGGVNDYSFAGPNTVDLVTLEYAVYHLGIRNATAVTVVHLGVMVVMGLWVAWQLYRRPALAPAPACSIIACFAAIFIYHRHYDMILLTLPLSLALVRCSEERTLHRWVYRACALGFVIVLFTSLNLLSKFIPVAQRPGVVGRFVEAVILPVDIWIILGATVALTLAERRNSWPSATTGSSLRPEPPPYLPNT